MTVMLDAASIRGATTGALVSKATAALPQSADGTLFTITGGRIVLVALVGEVTTIIETKANNTLIKFNPTAAGGADVDLCAALNITADVVGTYYTITGTITDALVDLLEYSSGGVLASPYVLSEGLIELECAASNTGSVSWDIIYYALDSDATVA